VQKELDECLSRESSEESTRTFVDELKKKTQILMVKEAEIDSLKRVNKELRETIEQNDTTKELQELKK
jgi:hypothetical protein